MGNKTQLAIIEVLKRYPELPTHFLTRLIGKPELSSGGFRRMNELNQLKAMTAAHTLFRYSAPNDKDVKVTKHYSYSLVAPGYKDRNQRPHRVLESIGQADTEIGVRADPNYEFIPFTDFLKKPDALPRPLLDTIDKGGDPHLIPLKDGHLHPDGSPFCVVSKKTDQHVNYIDEYDRDNEPLTTTKARRSIEEKWTHYHEFFKDRLWQKHYGFKNCMLRFFTTSEANMHSAMRLWENKYGKCPYILFATTKDWINEISYPRGDEIGATFRQSYLRIGHPDYYMNAV